MYPEQERLHIGATIDTLYRLLRSFIDGADVFVCQTTPLVRARVRRGGQDDAYAHPYVCALALCARPHRQSDP